MKTNITDTVDDLITNQSKLVIIVFLLITIIFFLGFFQISSDGGTAQFIDGIESVEALENINEEFQIRTVDEGDNTESTQLIQERRNVLSKEALLEQAKFEREISKRDDFRITNINSVSKQVALSLDPTSDTPSQRVNTLEKSTEQEIKNAVRSVLETDSFRNIVSDDYNSVDVKASITISTTEHVLRGSQDDEPTAGTEDSSPVESIQLNMANFADNRGYSITVFGGGIQSNELGSVITDSLSLVIPAALIFITIFLIVAYRDPFDIIIGLISLFIVLIWTFGFMGWFNIPFTQVLITIPPLILAVGIDFGIHSVNRFREEFNDKSISREEAMIKSNRPLFIAFALVAGSTSIGFGSNITSPLESLQEFGIVASIGIFFTFIVFGIFLPALKLEVDKLRDKYNVYEFGSKPIGNDNSIIGYVLATITKYNIKYPFVIIFIVLTMSIAGGMYAIDIDSEFSEETFLPPEELPSYIELAPSEIEPYQTPRINNLRNDNFKQFGESSLIIYISDNLRDDSSLEEIDRMNNYAPNDVIKTDENKNVEVTNIVSFIQNNEFSENTNQLIENSDTTNNNIPNRNIDSIYNNIESDNRQSQLYISEKRNSARVIYTVEESATTDEIIDAGNTITENTRLNAIPTGEAIVFNEVSDLLVDSTINSLIVSILMTIIFLTFSYKYINDSYLLGFINIIPVIVSVVMLAATMKYLGISLNPITSINLATSIGIGLDYTIHLTHRISDELNIKNTNDALINSVQKTGGALFGSAITTVFGIGSLYLAIIGVLAEFGLIVALGILYSFVFSILLIPPLYIIVEKIN